MLVNIYLYRTTDISMGITNSTQTRNPAKTNSKEKEEEIINTDGDDEKQPLFSNSNSKGVDNSSLNRVFSLLQNFKETNGGDMAQSQMCDWKFLEGDQNF